MYARAAAVVRTPRSVTLRMKARSLSWATMKSASSIVSSRRRRRAVSSTLPLTSRRDKKLANVLGDAAPERGERIAALERGDDPALGMGPRHRDQLARHPRVIGFGELETRQRILAVRVETGRN